MRLESGPAKKDALWQLGRAIVFLGFAAYFTYDGLIGYPAHNEREARTQLSAPTPFGGRVNYDLLGDKPDIGEYEQLRKLKQPIPRDQVADILGKPQLTETEGPRTREYFVSKYGYATITFEANRAVGVNWTQWYKSKANVQAQYYWALIPLLPGLYFLWKLLKALTLRVTLDDNGMDYAGRQITYADMVSLRDYSPKGWIDLYYKDAGRERRLRLDNEKVLLFDEIVDAICQVKGFPNEVRAYQQEQAESEAEQVAAEAAEDAAEEADSSEAETGQRS